MKTFIIGTILSVTLLQAKCQRQFSSADSSQREIISLGIGLGIDHGGFGINGIFYPTKNLGLFLGLGYNLAGLGYNAGVKLRFTPKNPQEKASAYLVAMYGYNGVIKVTDNIGNAVTKVYYGPTFGIGVDSKLSRHKKNYTSFAILVPIRPDYMNDYDALKNMGVQFTFPPLPILISFSYKFILN